jgi:hypothetical protein
VNDTASCTDDLSDRPIPFDTILDLCRVQQRRIVLSVLADEHRPLTVRDLTHVITTHNHDAPLTEVPEKAVTQIQVSLHHIHLPKLEAAGVIEYDPKNQLVELTNEFDQLQPALSTIVDADPGLDPPT